MTERTLRDLWDRIVDGAAGLLDRLADRVEGRPARDVCQACGRPARILYLIPGLGMTGGIDLRCDPCRATWHQAIRDFYAHRAADVAAANYALTRPPATLSRRERDGVREEAA